MRITFFLFLIVTATQSFSQIKLPRLISDGMILQREQKTQTWGWAPPGEKVTLTFNQKQYSTTADKEGKWSIALPPQKAGGPYEMTFSGSNSITIKNILFGDVWLCSGQSNMELTMQRVRYTYPDEVANAHNANIRQFEVPDTYNFKEPKEDLPGGQWLAATPENILKFSAVAYFFAKDLYERHKVPIGLLNAALGGSPAEAWISEEALRKFPAYYSELQKFKDQRLIDQIEAHDRKVQNDWFALLNATDEGVKGDWKNPALDDQDWKQMYVPGYWEHSKGEEVNGSVWFRKEVTIPKELTGLPAELLLGRIVDADSVFVNGRFVGTTSYQYPPRRYTLAAGVLQEGKNIIAIRVISQSGSGGFVPQKPYQLQVGNQTIDLKGSWKYRQGSRMQPLPGQTFVRWKPAGLFHAMIAPLANYPIKGVIWYQGESNADRPADYKALMHTLITDWRRQWKSNTLPFLFVQLANYMETQAAPAESNWAALRQAQLETLELPNTAMAVAIDLGEWNDIHPLNKRDVGKRLALQAERVAYGNQKIVASGPLFQSIKKKGNKLVLRFSSIDGGLVAKDGKELTHFAIAGKDRKFVLAKAQIKKNKVVVWSESIADPMVVRYGWANNPEGANLYNKAGLPASPFEAAIAE